MIQCWGRKGSGPGGAEVVTQDWSSGLVDTAALQDNRVTYM
jgi:hypothetical protein